MDEIIMSIEASHEVQQAPVDATLSISGMAADAKVTGDRIREVGTLVGGGDLPEGAETLTGAVIAVNNRIGTGEFPGETTTVIAALTYVQEYAEGLLGDTPLPRDAETVSDALEILSSLIGDGTLNPKYTGLIGAINTITTLIGDTALPAGSTTITEAISKLVSGALVSSVNGIRPDEDGNVQLPIVETVNHKTPDEDGNVNINTGAMTVNSISPDSAGDVRISEVDYANNLLSDNVQYSEEEFIARNTGGHASINDGDAWMLRIHGRRIHTGVVEEYLVPTVYPATRPEPAEGEDPAEEISISAFDKAVFRAYVDASTTITLSYTDSWSESPALYGLTVAGTPISGDSIQIVYVKEDRGTITQSTPTKFISTGWNLFNDELGEDNLSGAKVLRYSNTLGFKISGDYTNLSFSTTYDGETTPIVPVDGAFTVPSDGFVWVGGANPANTAIWMVWTDWGESYQGDFEQYHEDDIDLTGIMTEYFPNGLMQVGSVSDVIDLNAMSAVQYIERLEYNAENLALVQGREYEADTNWIYAVRTTPVINPLSITDISGGYTASDHGYEVVDGTTVPVYVETMYGNNLKNKLERNVLTISQQTLETAQQNQVRANIKATKALTVDMGTISALPVTKTAVGVTEKMVCVSSDLGTASAQTGDWTITTATDSVTISGTISGSTTVKLVLIEQDSVTATTQGT